MHREELVERVRALYDTFGSGDFDATRGLYAEDITWHVPGNNPVSGVYQGRDEYFGTMVARMSPLDQWRFDVEDVLTNERDHAALVRFRVTGQRKGRTVETRGFHMIRLDDAGNIREGWGFTENQDALDAFFSA